MGLAAQRKSASQRLLAKLLGETRSDDATTVTKGGSLAGSARFLEVPP